MTSNLTCLACLASTLFMTGLIWFVQVVHYPLFDHVGTDGFGRYHEAHSRLTTYVVIVPMFVELITSASLLVNRPSAIPAFWAWLGFAAALATWLSTAFVQVPLHEKLGKGFEAGSHRALVRTNAVRAILWTLHAAIMLTMTALTMA